MVRQLRDDGVGRGDFSAEPCRCTAQRDRVRWQKDTLQRRKTRLERPQDVPLPWKRFEAVNVAVDSLDSTA